MKALRRSSFLLVLAAAAFAQPVRFGGGPPPDLGQLAAEVRARPTDARSANPRFRLLMAALRARGEPPEPELGRKLARIRRLLGEGRLTQAGELIDAVVAGVQSRGEPFGLEAPRALAAPEAALAALPAASGLAVDALGTPQLSAAAPALLSVSAPAEGLAQPLAPALLSGDAPAAAAPASRPTPWFLLAGLASLGAFAGAGLLLRSARGAPEEKAAAPPAPDAGPAKTLAEKYSIGRAIASGGMGEVYEGRDLTLGRRVAIKRMLPDIKLDAGLRGQFLKEARTVAHPYIVPIHDCLESEGELYLVFEFVEGETLDRRLARDARLPLKECRRILGYVCAAVEHAHANHVLHRDLKPGNIMIDTGGIARVMDFGIALESTRTMTNSSPAVLDASGTLRYMPPEQHYGKSVRASDVYALGVCLYEMATGHPPFAAGTVDELIAAKRARRYPAPSSLYSELPKEFDLFIAAALAPDPQKRVSSAPEFLELLNELPA